MRIKAHPGLCEARGVCRRFAPSVYHLDADGYLDMHVVEVPPELEQAARLGAAACPEHAITIIDEPGVHGAGVATATEATRPTVLSDQPDPASPAAPADLANPAR